MNLLEQTGPRCRLCGHALKSSDGCTGCSPYKKNIVWPVLADPDEATTARALAQELATMLRGRLRKVRREIRKEGDEYNPQLTRELVSLTRATKEVTGEVRKLEDRDAAEYGKASFEDKIRLFVEQFFARLPQEFQIKILQRMKDTLELQAAPISIDARPSLTD